ncbi:MAG TPA: tetratricopeptide repeat protein [Planctomycetaceae bacterium]|nr:tetratricopeptide repeat protein [Planctomycetaceae bacterium]
MALDYEQKQKIANQWWRKGTDALAKQNWDYAIDAFGRAVEQVPANLVYRQSYRGAICKKYGDNKTGARMSGARLMGTRTKIKKARMQSKWDVVDQEATKGLAVNPWDTWLNAEIGEACVNLGYSEVAQFFYEKAVEGDPDNKPYNRNLALLLEERGNYSRAIECWAKIYKQDPLNTEARSKMTQLQAKTVMEGGYDTAKSTQEVRSGQTAYDDARAGRASGPAAADGPGMSAEADFQRAIRKEPANVQNYLKLADLYKRENRLELAAETFHKALDVSGGDPNVREQLEDVELDMLRHNLDLAKEAARANADDATAKKNTTALARELIQREIEVFSSRSERYPKDNGIKYELAKRYMRLQKWGQAIPLLQQASSDPRHEAEVLVALGECFLSEKKTPLAKRQFERVLPKLNPHDQADLLKKSRYVLGRLAEEAGDAAAAETHYNEILAIDYEYRDVLKRLEGLQGGGAAET